MRWYILGFVALFSFILAILTGGGYIIEKNLSLSLIFNVVGYSILIYFVVKNRHFYLILRKGKKIMNNPNSYHSAITVAYSLWKSNIETFIECPESFTTERRENFYRDFVFIHKEFVNMSDEDMFKKIYDVLKEEEKITFRIIHMNVITISSIFLDIQESSLDLIESLPTLLYAFKVITGKQANLLEKSL